MSTNTKKTITNSKNMKRISQGLIATSISLGSIGIGSAAFASYPASITGVWNGVANQTSVTITIVQSASTNACKPITGNMTNVPSTISGIYCPSSGLIVFGRSFGGSPTQFYVGNLSDTGLVLRMAGTFFALPGGGTPGEYGFSATR